MFYETPIMTHHFFFRHCDPWETWFDRRVWVRIFDWAKDGEELCLDILPFEFCTDLESPAKAKKKYYLIVAKSGLQARSLFSGFHSRKILTRKYRNRPFSTLQCLCYRFFPWYWWYLLNLLWIMIQRIRWVLFLLGCSFVDWIFVLYLLTVKI